MFLVQREAVNTHAPVHTTSGLPPLNHHTVHYVYVLDSEIYLALKQTLSLRERRYDPWV